MILCLPPEFTFILLASRSSSIIAAWQLLCSNIQMWCHSLVFGTYCLLELHDGILQLNCAITPNKSLQHWAVAYQAPFVSSFYSIRSVTVEYTPFHSIQGIFSSQFLVVSLAHVGWVGDGAFIQSICLSTLVVMVSNRSLFQGKGSFLVMWLEREQGLVQLTVAFQIAAFCVQFTLQLKCYNLLCKNWKCSVQSLKLFGWHSCWWLWNVPIQLGPITHIDVALTAV